MTFSRSGFFSGPDPDSSGGSSEGDPSRPRGEPARDAAAFAGAGGSRGAVLESAGLYSLLVSSVRDYAIFALDPTGHVLSWNEGAQRIKGYRAEEIVGKHFSIFYPEDKVAEDFPEYELKVAAREGRFEDEGWRVRKDGTRFWANVVITALRDSTGILVGYAKVTRDLTERKASEERAIADARRLAAAEASNRAKSEFLATMSHELRTPLNAIGGYAELLELGVAGQVSDRQREYLRRIRVSQQHLLGIINDLLNYSRIEAGQVSYDVQRVMLHDILERTLPMVAPQAATRGHALEHGPCAGELVARADAHKVEQIVLNLLSNAVKFTPEGGRIAVACGVAADRVAIAVSDTGPGIPPDQRGAVFEPFVQLGRSFTNPQEGTGLGLAISRDLARAMGGDLTVDDAPGGGARFTLLLPRGDD